MVGELGYVKIKEMFDGTNKSFEEFQFDTANQMTCAAVAEKRRDRTTSIVSNADHRREERGADNTGIDQLSLHGHGRRGGGKQGAVRATSCMRSSQ